MNHPHGNRLTARCVRGLKVFMAAALVLEQDPEPTARGALASRPDCPVDVLSRLAQDPHEYARRGVAMNPAAPPEVLSGLASDPHIQVRSRLPLNPAFPLRGCEQLLEDAERIVQDAATWRLLAARSLADILSLRDG